MPIFNDLVRLFVGTPNEQRPDYLILKDSRTASRVFGMRDSILTKIPRHKFLFYVNFLRPVGEGGPTDYGDWTTGISFLVKSVTRPNINFSVSTLNQYNKKRLAQNKISYEPVSVDFYDTYDQKVLQMFKEYLRFYYGDFQGKFLTSWNYDITSEEFLIPGGIDFGFVPPNASPNESRFFERIEVYLFGLGDYSKFSLINPLIKAFRYGNEDYTSSQDQQMITIDFDYEAIQFDVENASITADLASQFGLDIGDFNNVKFPFQFERPWAYQEPVYKNSPQNIKTSPIKPQPGQNPSTVFPNQNKVNPSYTPALNQVNPNWYNNTFTPGFNPNSPAPLQNEIKVTPLGDLQASSTSSTGKNVAQNSPSLYDRFKTLFG